MTGTPHAARKRWTLPSACNPLPEHILNAHLNDRKEIHVAVGLDVGKAFVTRLGKKGRRVTICFGPEVSTAERLQMQTARKSAPPEQYTRNWPMRT